MMVDEALAALERARQDWEDHPDAAHFHSLAEALSELVQAVVCASRRGNQAAFSVPLPTASGGIRVDVEFDAQGHGTLLRHRFARDFDDVVQEFLLETLGRFTRDRAFRVRHAAYVRMGLALKAFGQERSWKRSKITEQIHANSRQPASQSELACPAIPLVDSDLPARSEQQHDPLQSVYDTWFHYPGRQNTARIPSSAPALSLRHLYAALRVGSGMTCKQVAEELTVHPSRVTALGRELPDLFSQLPRGLLPLGDFCPIGVTPEVRQRLRLGKAGEGWDLKRRLVGQGLQTIQSQKRVLWEAYRISRAYLHEWIQAGEVAVEYAWHAARIPGQHNAGYKFRLLACSTPACELYLF